MRRLLTDKKGATAIEYGLIAALIVIAMMGALSRLGGGAGGMWSNIANDAETYM
ncbi:MAG: Flp family type IVb pilin [Sphingomicrobium sp.]